MIADVEDTEVTFRAIEQTWSVEPRTEFFGHSRWIQGEGIIQLSKETCGSLRGNPERDLLGPRKILCGLSHMPTTCRTASLFEPNSALRANRQFS